MISHDLYCDEFENSKNVEQLLQETFTNDFRTGYVSVEGVTMPDTFLRIADSIENLQVWDDDVWVCSFPKSGTTWTQEMIWCIGNDLDFAGAQVVLSSRFPFLESSVRVDSARLIKKFPELEKSDFVRDSVRFVADLPRPRFIKTHLPFHLLPRDLREGRTKAKIVYVCRNPKDVCISFYHHTKHFAFRGNFPQFCKLFLANKVPYSPFWDHISGFWKQRNNSRCNILFLRYEEMKFDLEAVIKKTVKFLGKPKLSSGELERLLDHLSFTSMKNNPAVNHALEFQFTKRYMGAAGDAEFIRQGQVNQWKSVMSLQMSGKFDEWIEKNLKGSTFSFDFFP